VSIAWPALHLIPEHRPLGGDNMNAPTATLTLKQRAYHGLKEFLVMTLYLWIVFALFLLYKSVLLDEQHISALAHGLALINALALAKVMLIAQDLHFADQMKERPLIYPTLFKSAAFAIILGCFKVLEETLIGLYHGRSFSESISGIGGGTLNGILVLTVILAVLLIPFFAFNELRAVLGKGRLRKLFFTSRQLDTTT
jgi:hypothetical protein